MLVALLLVNLEVTLRVEGDVPLAAAIASDAKRDLLRHRPAREKDGCFLAEQVRDARFELGHDRALAVAVLQGLGRRRLGELAQRVARARMRMVVQEAVASRPDGFAFGIHRSAVAL